MLLIYYPNQTDQRAWSSLDWPALPRISYFNPSEVKPISSRGLIEYCWCSKAPGFDSGSTVMLFSSPFFPWSFKQSPYSVWRENSQAKMSLGEWWALAVPQAIAIITIAAPQRGLNDWWNRFRATRDFQVSLLSSTNTEFKPIFSRAGFIDFSDYSNTAGFDSCSVVAYVLVVLRGPLVVN